MKNTKINISSFTLEFLLPDHAEDSFRGNDRDYKKIDGKAVVDKSLCILCGYCNPVCPEFAIRLI
ncbi:MAG TPA: hypothetical protein ENI51_02135 [Candidatus Atribacteria bacterium]|nr:hypothetical protein [Candidatus Atribacteria bacterium]